jgi:hypothetical protein
VKDKEARTLRFSVPRAPVSTNQMYLRRNLSGGGKGLMLSEKAKTFKASVRDHGTAAYISARHFWPLPEKVKQAELSIVVWNTRHDCSAAEKLVADALEGIFYKNDRAVHPRHNDIGNDGGEPRVEITLEILNP